MKIVHIVTYKNGGAYIAANRLVEALQSKGELSIICCVDMPLNLLQRRKNKFIRKQWNNYLGKKQVDDYFTSDCLTFPVTNAKAVQEADIIHLHWVADGISLGELRKLCMLKKPIVWTLHDMHPFTGGCHYSAACDNYKDKCGECPQLHSDRRCDFSTWNQKKKSDILRNVNLTMVGCSSWITQCAGQSRIMNAHKCINIPNCIDTELYRPDERDAARRKLGIDFAGKKIIAFGAVSATSDARKGYVYLRRALEYLDSEKYACLIFGGELTQESMIETKCFGKVMDKHILACIYSASDVFVAPSIEENLANTVMEALSCGTPVVAFEVGGMSDMISHNENGYLAERYDSRDLAEGIQQCAMHPEWRDAARKTVLEKFTYEKIAAKYMQVYQTALKGSYAEDINCSSDL